MEYPDDGPAVIIAALEDWVGERHEPPEKIERLDRFGFRHLIDDGTPLDLEIGDEDFALLPVD